MSSDLRLVLVHGAGRVGRDAFPLQAVAFPEAEFPVLPGYGFDEPAAGDVVAGARALAPRVADADGVVGYSYGGVVVAMASALEPPRALVLIEPALFQLCADRPATRRLRERLEPIYRDPTLTDASFERVLMIALAGHDAGPATTPAALRSSRRTRVHGAPWRHPIDPAAIAGVPTLVLTGGWNDEFEEVAAALVELGARHDVLPGHGHRVVDHPECSDRIRAFVTAV